MKKTKNIDVVILVGGKGTRIKKYSKRLPKPLIKISSFTFLDLLIQNISKYSINKIYLLAGYKGKILKKKYHKKKINLVDIECIVEKKLLGTGGCLKLIEKKISNNFIVVNGDTYFDINYKSFLNKKIKEDQILLSLCKNTNYKSNKKLISININKNDKVFYSSKSNKINGGIYKFNKFLLKKIPKNKKISLEEDIIPNYIKNKKALGIFYDNFFLDIGTPKNLIFAKKNLIKYLTKKALFLDRDNTMIEDKGYTFKIKDLKFKKNIISGLKYIAKKKCYIFIVTNQSGIGRGFYNEEKFIQFQTAIKKELEKKDIFINDVEYCPYHPHAKIKKYKKISSLRKPNNGMIKNILKKWPVNISQSLMVGDSITDEQCAKKSKLKFKLFDNNFLKICKNF